MTRPAAFPTQLAHRIDKSEQLLMLNRVSVAFINTLANTQNSLVRAASGLISLLGIEQHTLNLTLASTQESLVRAASGVISLLGIEQHSHETFPYRWGGRVTRNCQELLCITKYFQWILQGSLGFQLASQQSLAVPGGPTVGFSRINQASVGFYQILKDSAGLCNDSS